MIEINGGHHAEPKRPRYDQARTEWLEGRGLRVIRFTNRDIDTNMDDILQKIARSCGVEE